DRRPAPGHARQLDHGPGRDRGPEPQRRAGEAEVRAARHQAALPPLHQGAAVGRRSMVKVYALRTSLEGRRQAISDAVQAALVEAFGMPADKRAHRFFPLEREDLFAPPDRSENYLLIEFTVISGRSVLAKKKLVRAVF